MKEDPSAFKRNITGKETWIRHWEPGTKRQNVQKKHPPAASVKLTLNNDILPRNTLGFLWDVKGYYLVHCQRFVQTMTSAGDYDVLKRT